MQTFSNPLHVRLSARRGRPLFDEATQTLTIPSDKGPKAAKAELDRHLAGHDYVDLSCDAALTRSAGYTYGLRHADMLTNAVCEDASWRRMPVVDTYGGSGAYVLNLTELSSRRGDNPFRNIGKRNATLPDGTVEARLAAIEALPDRDLRDYQADVMDRFRVINGLTEGSNTKYLVTGTHQADLMDPGRGLEADDLGRFFDWKMGQRVSPSVLDCDCVAVPGVSRTDLSGDLEFIASDGTPLPPASSLACAATTGIAIPMEDDRGRTVRFQIASDVLGYNTKLECRAADGATVSHGSTYDKDKREYRFLMDGKPSHLRRVHANPHDKTVDFEDAKGRFTVRVKDDVTQLLIDRGYELPEPVEKVKLAMEGKYIWLSTGDMCGHIPNEKERARIRAGKAPLPVSERCAATLPGIVRVNEPQNGCTEYVGIICEGALKGVIAGKYLDIDDKNGDSVADVIRRQAGLSPDAGIVLIQVPGVAGAFSERAVEILNDLHTADGRPAHVAETIVAMDADGRKNFSVATGIHVAEENIREMSDARPAVMLWDPEQKGLDDALLAIAQGKITVGDLGLSFGSAQEQFPVDFDEDGKYLPTETCRYPRPYRVGDRLGHPTGQASFSPDRARMGDESRRVTRVAAVPAPPEPEGVPAAAANPFGVTSFAEAEAAAPTAERQMRLDFDVPAEPAPKTISEPAEPAERPAAAVPVRRLRVGGIDMGRKPRPQRELSDVPNTENEDKAGLTATEGGYENE